MITISSQHIQIAPGVCCGIPRIAGHRIRVQDKEYKAGERREFFTAKKDLDEWAVKIARERSKREI